MQILPSELRVGDPVRIRGQRWRVREIRDFDALRLVTVAGTGPGNRSATRRFLAAFERMTAIGRVVRPRPAGSRAWRRTAIALLAADAPPDGLRTAARADLDLLPHQLEPALAILRGLGTRVLLADDVGLGKTVQAGLVVAELRERGLADRVLVATPAGLRDQWRDELRARFAIESAVIDARELRRRSALAPLGTNPWTTVDVAIASTDFVKRPDVLPGPLDARWDVVIVDEAHGASTASDRHAAISALCRRAACVLLVSATPHSGDRASFDALCGLGEARGDSLLIFRRTREEVAPGVRRRVHRLLVVPSSAECLVHERLEAFERALRREGRADEAGLRLGLGVLVKRACSSPWSLARSIERRLAAVVPRPVQAAQYRLPFPAPDGEDDGADEPPPWTLPPLDDPGHERRLLGAILDAARAAAAADSKLLALRRLLRRVLARGEQAIVFTEYRDTLLHLRRSIGRPAAVLHGGLSRDDRRQSVAEFTSGRVRVLLATDAAGEGLNLQSGCRVVINLELPWNPNRLEQRAGRVDRIGQRRTVHAFHLLARGTGESAVLERLRTRIVQARHDIGAADPLALTGDGAAANPPAASTPPRTSIDASAEHARLVLARRLAAGAGAPDVRPVAGRAERALRAWLRGRGLAVFSSSVEDAAGRAIAVRVTPALLQFTRRLPGRMTRVEVEALAAASESALARVENESIDEWASAAVAMHQRLVRLRLAREGAIREGAGDGRLELQPGLFDRRAAKEADDRLARHSMWTGASDERVSELEAALGRSRVTTRVALLLLP